MDWLYLMSYIRSNGTPESESQDYKPNNSYSASPKIGEIGTSQVSHIMVAILSMVILKFFSEISVAWIFFHNFKAKFVYHDSNCFIAVYLINYNIFFNEQIHIFSTVDKIIQ